MIALVLSGCSLQSPALVVRSSWRSSLTSPFEVKVWLEGADGRMVDGALVQVGDPLDRWQTLSFTAQQGAYTWTLQTGVESGDYRLRVKSRLTDETSLQVIPHWSLGQKPQVDVLRDDEGRSVFLGQSPKAGRPLEMSWTSVPHAQTYTVRIYDGSGATVFSRTVPDALLFLGAGLASGDYSVQVQADNLSGDPLFLDHSYVSSSHALGSRLNFSVQP